MIPFADNRVEEVFESYPVHARPCMFALRDLIFTTAQQMGLESDLVETLKWGEPSYLSPNGATLRIHWEERDFDHCRLFFHCQTSLVPTFRESYPSDFKFEDSRAIRISLDAETDLCKLAHCIEMSLNYHLIKKLPKLGGSAR